VGRFDTYPDDDSSDFAGAWSVYPYFKSGLLAVSSIEEGLFLVKRAESSRRLRGARV
jgi:Zn/Cd-binding protein ZinT